uniref:ATP-dependent RNA helicase n=1 Tax=Electrophorus electricus TaxID=8005 RepID=A0A4W4HPL1_ELEEL
MTEDTLMINISSPLTNVHSISSKKGRRLSRQKWTANNTRTGKRKASSGVQAGGSAKRRTISASSRHVKPNSAEREKRAAAPVPKLSAKARTSPQVPGESKEHDRTFIKTSSLFRNNPEIPDVLSPVVTQVTEKVFTGNSFQELELHPHLVATLSKVLNVTSMTSVQKQTIPVLLSGKDAVVRSQTGSGKTLAYGIPLVQSLQAIQPKVKRSDGPLAVVIVPTRELAQQSFQIFQKLLKPFTWIVPGVLMGGEKRKAEKARLRKGINILISTPGRLVDHIKNTLSIAFSAVRWLVLDEADRTLDLGFEKDLTVVLNALNTAGSSRQNVLLSATLTEGLSRLASVSMTTPVYVHVSEAAGSSAEAAEHPRQAAPPAAPQVDSYAVPSRLQQHVVVVPSKLRLVCLAAVILAKCKYERGQKLIVFVSSCEAVEFLLTLLSAVLSDKPAGSHKPQLAFGFFRLHGNMQQQERTEVFQEFSQSQSGVLLCTDVAARGLDLPQVTWIVQYDPPVSAAEYVHRVGRTARIGARGSGLLFLTPSETAYVDVLASHNISLCEMKMEDVLSTLMQDDHFKGRGRWEGKKAGSRELEMRERATVLQTDFENFVHGSPESVQAAKKALQSYVRAYTAYPSALKHVFHIRNLHLGHAAKSFGLRDAPQGLSLAAEGTTKGSRKDIKRCAVGFSAQPARWSVNSQGMCGYRRVESTRGVRA